MPVYGLRLRSYSQSLGSAFDWFVPESDMPEAPNKRGYLIARDKIQTPNLNTYLYDKGKVKHWILDFKDISTVSKERLEHCCHGWLRLKQITMVYFGTLVFGTTDVAGNYAASQVWGTGFVEIQQEPAETAYDLWDISIEITQFGTSQSFT